MAKRFFLCLVFLFVFLPFRAFGEDSQTYLNRGEGALFSGNISEIKSAYQIFSTAREKFSNDPVINLYLAVSRVLNFVFDTDPNSSFNKILKEYGITKVGDNLENFEFLPTRNGGDTVLPDTAPSVEHIRQFLAGDVITLINNSLDDLNNAIQNWQDGYKYILKKELTNNDKDVEISKGDVYLLMAGLRLFKCLILIATSYNSDIDPKELLSLGIFDQSVPYYLLNNYPNILKILNDGASKLSSAKGELLAFIDDYLKASDMIRNDTVSAGSEKLIELSQDQIQEEALFREGLTKIREAIQNNTYAQLQLKNGRQLKVDPNKFFDNPKSLRDYLPLVNIRGQVVYGTVGHGLRDDPTLGGILPDFTQDMWADILKAEDGPVYAKVLIPQKTINIKDSSLSDWQGIEPVFRDRAGDGDPNVLGSDIRALYLARDENYLYGRLDLDAAPDREKAFYWISFSPNASMAGGEYGALSIEVRFEPGKGWVVDAYSYSRRLSSGFAKVTGNSLEWELPLFDLKLLDGGYLAIGSGKDRNDTCIQVVANQLYSISGTVNVPAFDGKGRISVLAYQLDRWGYFDIDHPMKINMLSFRSNPQAYTIEDLPPGDYFVIGFWDRDYNGQRSYGDYLGFAGPITVSNQNVSNVNLSITNFYADDDQTPRFILCKVVPLSKTDNNGTSTGAMLMASVDDPNGRVPDTIRSLEVRGPGNFRYSFSRDEYDKNRQAYIHYVFSSLEKGDYYFTVTDDDGNTFTSSYYFQNETPINPPSDLKVSGDTNWLTFSWVPDPSYQGPMFYRVDVYDSEKNLVWSSDATSETAVDMPTQILGANKTYTWSLKAWKPELNTHEPKNLAIVNSMIDPNNFDQSSPYFYYSRIFRLKDKDGTRTYIRVKVSQPFTYSSTTIEQIKVYDPDGNLYATLTQDDFDKSTGRFEKIIGGACPDGTYKIVAHGSQNSSRTTYEYVSPEVDLPIVENLRAYGSIYSPVLTWTVPQTGRRLYFYVIIMDQAGNRVWESPFTFNNYISVPRNILNYNQTYRWMVLANDTVYRWNLSNQTKTEPVELKIENELPAFNWAVAQKTTVEPNYFSSMKRPAVIGDTNGTVYTYFSVSAVDPDGSLPNSITNLTVTDPDGNFYDLKAYGGYRKAGAMPGYFFLFKEGAPTPGVYKFDLKDEKGNTLTTYQWVGDSPDMPVVPQNRILTYNAPDTTPWGYYDKGLNVSWEGVKGRNGYYNCLVHDYFGSYVWATKGSEHTQAHIPAWTEDSLPVYEHNNMYIITLAAYSDIYSPQGISRSISGPVIAIKDSWIRARPWQPPQEGVTELELLAFGDIFDGNNIKNYAIHLSTWNEERWGNSVPVGVFINGELKVKAGVGLDSLWTPPAIPIGQYLDPNNENSIRFCVDPENTIPEEDETNNCIAFMYLPQLRGDIDGDRFLTLYDAITVLRVVSGLPVEKNLNLLNADMDGNKKIGLPDAVIILRRVAGL